MSKSVSILQVPDIDDVDVIHHDLIVSDGFSKVSSLSSCGCCLACCAGDSDVCSFSIWDPIPCWFIWILAHFSMFIHMISYIYMYTYVLVYVPTLEQSVYSDWLVDGCGSISYIYIYNYIIYIYVILCSPQVDVQWCTSILLLVSRYSADHRGWTTLLSSRTSQDFTVDVSSKPWWTSGYGSPNVGTNWGSPVCCLPCDPTRSSHPTRPHLLN